MNEVARPCGPAGPVGMDRRVAGISGTCQLTFADPLDVSLDIVDATHPGAQRIDVQRVRSLDASGLEMSGCSALAQLGDAASELHDYLVGIAISQLTAPACRACGSDTFGLCPP